MGLRRCRVACSLLSALSPYSLYPSPLSPLSLSSYCPLQAGIFYRFGTLIQRTVGWLFGDIITVAVRDAVAAATHEADRKSYVTQATGKEFEDFVGQKIDSLLRRYCGLTIVEGSTRDLPRTHDSAGDIQWDGR